MTLEDLGNLGEFVAAIATLITLVYLALQIRQNTKTVRTSTYQAILESNRQAQEPILSNPNLERIYRIGRRDINELTAEERPLFRMLVNQLLVNYEAIYLQHSLGVVDPDYWRGRRVALRHLLSQPGVRAAWERGGGEWCVTGFRDLVDSILQEIELDQSERPGTSLTL